MYCKICGKEIASDSIYCKHCGGKQDNDDIYVSDDKLTEEQDDNQAGQDREIVKIENTIPSKQKKPSKRIIWTLTAIFLAIAGLLVYLLLSKPQIADSSIDKVSKGLADACKRYDNINVFHCGLAMVEKGNKFGFIDKLGSEIIPCEYDEATDFENDYSVVKKNDLEGVINRNGHIVIPIKYEYVSMNSDTSFCARINEKSGVLDKKGNVIIPFEYDYCDHYTDGFYVIRPKKDRTVFGLIDKKTRKLLNNKYYDNIKYGFSDGLCAVEVNGKWSYIDKSGEIIISNEKYSDGYELDGDVFNKGLASISSGGEIKREFTASVRTLKISPHRFVFIDKKGNIVSEPITGYYDDFVSAYGYYVVTNYSESISEPEKQGIINGYGNWVVPMDYWFLFYFDEETIEDGIIFVNKYKDKWGAFDIISGKMIIPCEKSFNINPYTYSKGLFTVEKDGLYGWMNKHQEIVIPCIYDSAGSFSEGFACVSKNGVLGYVDKYGNDTFQFTK